MEKLPRRTIPFGDPYIVLNQDVLPGKLWLFPLVLLVGVSNSLAMAASLLATLMIFFSALKGREVKGGYTWLYYNPQCQIHSYPLGTSRDLRGLGRCMQYWLNAT